MPSNKKIEKRDAEPKKRIKEFENEIVKRADQFTPYSNCPCMLRPYMVKYIPIFSILTKIVIALNITVCIFVIIIHIEDKDMRTNIVIDDQIMKEAQAIGGYRTKKETVEAGLKLIVHLKKQEKIKKFRGKLKWNGDLDEMRTDT